MNVVLDFLAGIWALREVQVVVGLTVINFIVAVMAAVRTGEFEWVKLKDFLIKDVLAYMGVFAVTKAFEGYAGISGTSTVVAGVLSVSMLARLAENLKKFGVSLPNL